MNQENKIEKIDSLPIPINENSSMIYSGHKLSSELIVLKEETIDGFKFRHVFHNGSAYCLIQDYYAQLGHKDPKTSTSTFHYRNKHIFDPEAFRKVEFETPRGKRTYLTATLEVITFICARARTKKGDDFLKATGKLIRKLSEEKVSLSPSHETINLMLRDWSFHNELVVKDLDQIKSVVRDIPELKKGLEDLAVQINSQTETPAGPLSGTITDKIRNIKVLIKNTAQREGVHFNKICNEFKKYFQLRSYADLEEKDYHEAIAWFNARQDKVKQEKNTVSKKGSNLDKWFKPEKKDLGDYN